MVMNIVSAAVFMPILVFLTTVTMTVPDCPRASNNCNQVSVFIIDIFCFYYTYHILLSTIFYLRTLSNQNF